MWAADGAQEGRARVTAPSTSRTPLHTHSETGSFCESQTHFILDKISGQKALGRVSTKSSAAGLSANRAKIT